MKTILYTIKDDKYKLIYDRMCNQGAWEYRCFRWFLWWKRPIVDERGEWEYQGDFTTKKEAEEYMGFN